MPKQYSAPPPMTIDANKTYTATMDTSLGTIKLELDFSMVQEAVKK